MGTREFQAEVSWDLPSLAPGANNLLDVTVDRARQGDLAAAALVSSTRSIALDADAWATDTVPVEARNISGSTFDLASVTLSVAATKRRVPLSIAGRRGGACWRRRTPARADRH